MFMRLLIAISFIAIFHVPVFSQNLWKTLSRITYTKEYDDIMGFKVDKPVFSDEIKALDGKTVEVHGFIIPTEGYKSHTEFILSAYPYTMCFFCGGAGPETVMEVTAKTPVKFSNDAIDLRGTLRLNATDINRLMYFLEDAELVE